MIEKESDYLRLVDLIFNSKPRTVAIKMAKGKQKNQSQLLNIAFIEKHQKPLKPKQTKVEKMIGKTFFK